MKTSDQPVLRLESQDSPRTVSTGETPPEKSQKQLLLATQNSSLEEFSEEIVRSTISSFSVIFSFPTIYFSTPPGVCQNKKNPSHFTLYERPRAEFQSPTAFGALAELSPQHESDCETDPPIADAFS
jgi:hypothetical protein